MKFRAECCVWSCPASVFVEAGWVRLWVGPVAAGQPLRGSAWQRGPLYSTSDARTGTLRSFDPRVSWITHRSLQSCDYRAQSSTLRLKQKSICIHKHWLIGTILQPCFVTGDQKIQYIIGWLIVFKAKKKKAKKCNGAALISDWLAVVFNLLPFKAPYIADALTAFSPNGEKNAWFTDRKWKIVPHLDLESWSHFFCEAARNYR